MGHAAEVDLHERPKLSALPVNEDHHRVRGKRTLLTRVFEWLAGFALTAVLLQRKPDLVRFGIERHK